MEVNDGMARGTPIQCDDRLMSEKNAATLTVDRLSKRRPTSRTTADSSDEAVELITDVRVSVKGTAKRKGVIRK